MSQERTEQPTGKRLRDARERGQIARSKEVQDAVQLAATLTTLTWLGGYMVSSLADRVASGISGIDAVAHKPVLPAELTARWIADGLARRIVEWKREELAARQQIARRVLGWRAPRPSAPHVWLTMPPHTGAEDSVKLALEALSPPALAAKVEMSRST